MTVSKSRNRGCCQAPLEFIVATTRQPWLTTESKGCAVRLTDMPDGDRLCHAIFIRRNVLGSTSHPVVIDWPDACRGDRAVDAYRSYLFLKLNAEDTAEPYLEGWCRMTNVAHEKGADWLPYVAAARLAEDILAEFDRLMEIADR